ncbi:uncharacterized protein LOC111266095 [Varroa jacobsoni]|uniref:uncharacterized protein LOC111266095 n=1 Tax=Varroa jacobsoni TaxID=62625 RepID=UPI000BFA5B03|nr:uncharacterized protein LOC111266095 [Varroa jacobsoni]
MGSVLAAESPPKSGSNSEQNAAIDVVDSLLMVTSTAMPASLPESTALKVAEPLPIAEAHVSAQIQMASAGSDQIHSGGPKFRKAAESSTREMPATSTVSPTAFLVNDNARDNRDRFYPETRYDNRYPDYRHDNRYDNRYPDYRYDNRYDNRYAPGVGGSGNYGVYGPGSAYRNALVSNVDRRFYRGYNPYYNEAWRRNFYDPYYDQHGPYFLNYGRDGRAYGERLPYHPYGNDYFYRPDRIDPYRFGYSTDKLGRGFGYSCKDVFECQDLKNREDAAREAQRRSYGPPAPLYNQPYHPSPAPYQPSSATYRVPYENANLWYLPTATPSSGRSVTYFSQDRYDPYFGGYYSDMYAGYPGYAPYFHDRYRDYSRGKKK